MRRLLATLVTTGVFVHAIWSGSALAQTAADFEALKQELRRMQDRLQRLEQAEPVDRAPQQRLAPSPSPVAVPLAAQAPPAVGPRPGEREIQLEREHPAEMVGLPKPEIGGVRISGFFVGSANYNSRIQMVPEFAGNAGVSSEPRSLDFRFDQFTIGAYKTFSPWLSAGASLEVERHGHRHSHGFDPDFGCPTLGDPCIEQFGDEAITTEVSLHRFNITGIAPVGFTPLSGAQLLNFGLGGWWGPEQDGDTKRDRWILDFDVTWTPISRLLLAGEFVYGGESGVSFRRRGTPFAAAAVLNKEVNWSGLYALAHYDIFNWLGLSFRYGFFDDKDGARTGVAQTLQSFTIVPIVHLSRLIPDLRPLGVTYARTRHPLDWVDLRLEYRLDHSNKSVFSDAKPGVPIPEADRESHQVTMQLVVNF